MNYEVPFVDFPTQYHRLEGEIMAAIKEVFSGGDFILRHQVKQFEENIASLPLNTEISNEQVEYVIDSIRNFYMR